MIALVTATVAAHLDPDLRPLENALRDRGGGAVDVIAWDDPDVDWSSYSAAVIRSTWDYTDRLDEFLAWVDHVGATSRLVNGADVVRWSTDKRYLADLAAEGVEVTPTVFVSPGEIAPEVRGLHVVKPTVGAGSSGARRCSPDEVADHVATLHADGRTAMVQPYLDRLDELGETALCFVAADGSTGLELSHAFRKGAILTSTDVEQEEGLFAKEDIRSRVPSVEEIALAERVLSTDVVRGLGDLVFARIDIAPHRGGSPETNHVVMEVELIEPSFYFETDPTKVDLFADRLIARLGLGGHHEHGVDRSMTDGATERVDVLRVVGRGIDRTTTVRPDDVIVEEPMSIRLDGVLVSTTMRTPGHDYELAVGFCLTDGLLAGAEVTAIRYCTDVPGDVDELNTVDVDTDGRAPTPTPRLGNVSSSCGWCGSEHIDALCERLSPLPDVAAFDFDVLGSIADAARGEQGLFSTTGSVHAAAVFDSRGEILLTREDVGRHNAVDKVVGALALGTGYPVEIPANGFGLFVSGRASIEMVQKAWAAGFTALVSVSAPTALAVDAARRANLTLVGFVRGDAFNVYAPRR